METMGRRGWHSWRNHRPGAGHGSYLVDNEKRSSPVGIDYSIQIRRSASSLAGRAEQRGPLGNFRGEQSEKRPFTVKRKSFGSECPSFGLAAADFRSRYRRRSIGTR